MATESSPKKTTDPRPRTVGAIWAAAMGMLAICIPLCAVLRTAALPFFVIAGAAFATLYIWQAGAAKQQPASDDTEALLAKIKELEERLANVEVINRFEGHLAEKQMRAGQEKQGMRRDEATEPASEKV